MCISAYEPEGIVLTLYIYMKVIKTVDIWEAGDSPLGNNYLCGCIYANIYSIEQCRDMQCSAIQYNAGQCSAVQHI